MKAFISTRKQSHIKAFTSGYNSKNSNQIRFIAVFEYPRHGIDYTRLIYLIATDTDCDYKIKNRTKVIYGELLFLYSGLYIVNL